VLQMVVYRQIARQARVALYLWAASVLLLPLGVLVAGTNRQLVLLVLAVAVLVTLPVMLVRPTTKGPAAVERR
jgi:hypothetical protein